MSTFTHISRVLLGVLNVAVCSAMLVSAYAGCLSPDHHAWAGVAVLTMPICLGALILTAIIDAFAWRRLLILPLLCLLATLGPVYNLVPISVLPSKIDNRAKTFTLLTYNVANFQFGRMEGDSINSTLQYLIDSDADVVCIQEDIARYGVPYAYSRLADNQLDTLAARYPYHYAGEHGQTLYSRFKATPVEYRSFADIYRLDVDGEHITLINVHLQSLQLSADDRELYTDLSTLKKTGLGPRGTVSSVRHELIDKISAAYAQRGRQADELTGLVKKFGGPNVIITGDFNDVPGCYTLRQLDDAGMQQAYPAVGTGYRFTYNTNRMYFRIDHILYKGDLQPVSVTCDHVPYSDHYPQIATFAIAR